MRDKYCPDSNKTVKIGSLIRQNKRFLDKSQIWKVNSIEIDLKQEDPHKVWLYLENVEKPTQNYLHLCSKNLIWGLESGEFELVTHSLKGEENGA